MLVSCNCVQDGPANEECCRCERMESYRRTGFVPNARLERNSTISPQRINAENCFIHNGCSGLCTLQREYIGDCICTKVAG
jgi:hypothetical protein